jgi:hypothetical protein
MHNADKDIIFKSLKAKLSNYEAAEATDSDWEQFANARSVQKRKGFWVKAGIAIGLLTIVLISIGVVVSTLNSNEIKLNQQAVSNKTTGSANKIYPTKSKNTFIGVSKTTTAQMSYNNGVAIKPISQPKIEGELKEITSEEINVVTQHNYLISYDINKDLTQREKGLFDNKNKPTLITNKLKTDTEPLALNSQIEMIKTTEEKLVLPQVLPIPEIIKSRQHLVAETIPKPLSLISVMPHDSTKYLPSKTKKQNRFVDVGFLAIQPFNEPKEYPSDLYFKGAMVSTGKLIAKNWFVTGGFQYAQMREISSVYIRNQQEQKEIISIDTSLKFISSANRIMMQVDTLSNTRIIETEKEYQLNSLRTWYAIPLMAGYQIGSLKRSLHLSGGITNILVNSQNTNLVITENSERLVIKSQYNLIIAPTIGIGAYHRINNFMGIHCSGQYLFYLPNGITTQQSFQLQTGLRIKF